MASRETATLVIRTIKSNSALGDVEVYFDPRSLLFGWQTIYGIADGGFDSYKEAVENMCTMVAKLQSMMNIPEKRISKAKRLKRGQKSRMGAKSG